MSGKFPRSEFIEEAKSQHHSDEFIRFTLGYIDRLETKGLPVIFSLKHLGTILDIDFKVLKEYTQNRERYYGRFKLKKKRGGFREIRVPNSLLKSIQYWIQKKILLKASPSVCSTAFYPGCSIYNNAERHLAQESVLSIDLFKFFDSITDRRIYKIFKSMGYHSNVAVDLARLCTVGTHHMTPLNEEQLNKLPERFPIYSNVLPQGAPTSPMLANLAARNLDQRLFKLSEKIGVNYSRYADDLTFSGKKNQIPRLKLIYRIIHDEGFFVNYSKNRQRNIGQKQLVTGLIVSGDTVRVQKSYKKDIWKHLYYCKKFGVAKHSDYFGNSFFSEWLLGRIFFVKSIEPDVGKDMLKAYNELDWAF
ncbi:reverse transcriptase family protein [Shouchella miscanthi]|uniref:RNA-directed DNA polymerase n=1 Tax=Shouchella miscanthi TaxID=2598861 RepID=A0ABU6NTC6_9BACI|nr:reverse transcriptase family protein [Shouchella miscanthi]